MSDHDEGLRDENANQQRNKGKDEAQYSARNCESGANSSCGAGNVGRMNDVVFLSKEMVTPYRWCPLLVNRRCRRFSLFSSWRDAASPPLSFSPQALAVHHWAVIFLLRCGLSLIIINTVVRFVAEAMTAVVGSWMEALFALLTGAATRKPCILNAPRIFPHAAVY